MKKSKHKIFVFLIVWAFVFVFCSKDKSVELEENRENIPDQEMWDTHLKATKNGRLEAIVNFGHMVRYEGNEIALLDEGVIVDFFDARGEHSSTLTSLRGEFNDKTNDVKAMGNVIVVSDTGVTLHTEELFFDHKTEKVISNVDVMVTTNESDTLYGTSFISNTAFTEWQITNTRAVSHSSVDLSADRFKKQERPDSTNSVENDSLAATKPDSVIEAIDENNK
jgi:LPS export ABC transporter protein LptC